MKILYFAVSSGVLIGSVLIIRRLFRKQLSPMAVYALWLIPFLRLMIPFGFGGLSAFGEAGSFLTAPYVLMERAAEGILDGEWIGRSEESSEAIKEGAAIDGGQQGAVSDTAEISWDGKELKTDGEVRESGRAFAEVREPIFRGIWLWEHPFYLIWMAGSLLLGSFVLISNRRLKQSVGRMETAENMCGLPVRCSDAVVSPCLFGLFHPCILVNQRVLQDEKLLRQVLRHELAHYRQKDHIWTFFRIVLCVLYWWNPFVWAGAVCSKEDAELSCDSRAVRGLEKRERREYGLALLELLEQAGNSPGLMYGATSMSGRGRSLKRRMEGIAEDVPTRRRVLLPVCLMLTAALLCGCAVPGNGSYIQSGWKSSDESSLPVLEISSSLQEDFQSRLFYTEIYKNGELAQRSVRIYGALDSLDQTTRISLNSSGTEDGPYDSVDLIVDDGGASYEAPVALGEEYGGAPVIVPLETERKAVDAGEDLILLSFYAQKEEGKEAPVQMSCEDMAGMSEEEISSVLVDDDLVILVRQVLSGLPEDELAHICQEREYPPSKDREETAEDIEAPENMSVAEAEELAKLWTDAFIDRDGRALAEMMTEETRRQMQDMELLGTEEDGWYFGWSSPWPMFGNELYRILSCTEEQAEILYYAGDSTPHLYVWREILTFEREAGEYKVLVSVHEMLDSIDTAEDFRHAYPDGMIEGTAMDYASNGLGEALNNNAKETDDSYYERYFDPVTSARDLLNLADGSTGARMYAEEAEGRTVVHITFLKDGSTADVEMIQPYGEDGIWIPR